MKKINKISTIFLILGISTSLSAQNIDIEKSKVKPSWNEVSINYLNTNVKDTNIINPEGFSIQANKLISKHVFLTLGFDYLEQENISGDKKSIGFGIRSDIGKTTDVYSKLTYERMDMNVNDIYAYGYGLSLGLRHIVNNKVELSGEIKTTELNNIDEQSLKLNIDYLINNNFSIGVGNTFTEDYNMINAGFKLIF